MTELSILRARRRACALLVVVTVCATGAACGADSTAKATTKRPQPILTEKSVVQAWKDYDKANNAAMPKAGPPAYDGMAHAAADVGPSLDRDLILAKSDRLLHEKANSPVTTTSKALYAPVEGAGFALSTTVGSHDGPKDPQHLTSIVRVGDPETWKREMSVDVVRPHDLPGPLEGGQATTADESDRERARKVVTAVAGYWQTLRKPAGIDLGTAVEAEFASTLRGVRRSPYDESFTVRSQGITRTPGAGEALRVVRARGGLLVLANLRVRTDYESHQKDVGIIWHGLTGRIVGSEPTRSSRVTWSTSLAISVPDRGTATVLGGVAAPLIE